MSSKHRYNFKNSVLRIANRKEIMNREEKKLIIFTHGVGRFGNQLIAYGHLIAFLLENEDRFDFINMSFWDYAHLLESTSQSGLCTSPTKHQQWQYLRFIRYLQDFKLPKGSARLRTNIIRILYALVRNPLLNNYGTQSIIVNDANRTTYVIGTRRDYLDLNDSDNISIFDRANVTLLSGWGIRNWSLFEKHQHSIRDCMKIRRKYTEIGEKFISNLRKRYDIIIGVMIRQGDYQIWINGRYFFETEQYVEWMRQVQIVFGESTQNIGFVVSSDEQQEIEKFHGLNVHFTTGIAGGSGHYVESMVELSLCDMIMTPPSTFSTWAAFIGDIPIIPLYDVSQVMKKDDVQKRHIYDAIRHPHLSMSVC